MIELTSGKGKMDDRGPCLTVRVNGDIYSLGSLYFSIIHVKRLLNQITSSRVSRRGQGGHTHPIFLGECEKRN